MAKMTVQFDGKINEILEQLAAEKRTTKADVLRRAVALYRFLDEEQKQLKRKVSITEDEKVVKEIVIP